MLHVKGTCTKQFTNKLGALTNSELTPKHPLAWISLHVSLVHLSTYRFINRFGTMGLTSTFCFCVLGLVLTLGAHGCFALVCLYAAGFLLNIATDFSYH